MANDLILSNSCQEASADVSNSCEQFVKCTDVNSACEKSIVVSTNFSVHLHSNVEPKTLTCKTCGKGLSNQEVNLQAQTGDACLVCNLCTPEKRFACSVCDQKFSWGSHLKRHFRTHTGEKPFVCSICNKRITTRSNWKTHLRTHTGEKPFVCITCKKGFSRRNEFKAHLRIHTGEKPFVCVLCNKGFSQATDWKAHLRIHTGEKPYVCNVCNKGFARGNSLRRHVHTIHMR